MSAAPKNATAGQAEMIVASSPYRAPDTMPAAAMTQGPATACTRLSRAPTGRVPCPAAPAMRRRSARPGSSPPAGQPSRPCRGPGPMHRRGHSQWSLRCRRPRTAPPWLRRRTAGSRSPRPPPAHRRSSGPAHGRRRRGVKAQCRDAGPGHCRRGPADLAGVPEAQRVIQVLGRRAARGAAPVPQHGDGLVHDTHLPLVRPALLLDGPWQPRPG